MTGRWPGRFVVLCATWFLSPSWGSAQEPQARLLWEQGQAAMKRGDGSQAIDLYHQCLKQDPSFVRAHLSLAAVYIEQGNERLAVPHLASYIHTVPEHTVIRVHYADILFRMQLWHESQAQFEECVVCLQERGDVAPNLLIEIHSKLMEIAEVLEDEYAERLERGIGLYLLACERSRLADPDGTLSVEGLLCRAMGELKEAIALRPKEARPNWYLYLTWSRLKERPQALQSLRQAERLAILSDMTPSEKQELEFARRKIEIDETRPATRR
jgi:tetratricopeptide (TPR) repeat protein